MTPEKPAAEPLSRDYVELFLEEVTDPIHKRLIEAYRREDSVASMESELGRILEEVVENEA
jgi:hypothetical protein